MSGWPEYFREKGGIEIDNDHNNTLILIENVFCSKCFTGVSSKKPHSNHMRKVLLL